MIIWLLINLLSVTSAVSLRGVNEFDKVSVEVFTMSGCMRSKSFLSGELSDVLSIPEIEAIIDLKLIPYGSVAVDQQSDVEELCGMYAINKDINTLNKVAKSVLPFIICVENNFDTYQGEECWNSTMSTVTNVTWSEVEHCAYNDYERLQHQLDLPEAVLMAYGSAEFPYILVNSKELPKPEMLLMYICDSYKGLTPPICLV